MATNTSARFDFLTVFIQKMFDQNGFLDMKEETRKQFVPLFTAEAERRLGITLMPMLSEDQTKDLVRIVENEKSTADDLANFWKNSIPNFENVVEKALNDFAVEFKSTLAKVAQ